MSTIKEAVTEPFVPYCNLIAVSASFNLLIFELKFLFEDNVIPALSFFFFPKPIDDAVCVDTLVPS